MGLLIGDGSSIAFFQTSQPHKAERMENKFDGTTVKMVKNYCKCIFKGGEDAFTLSLTFPSGVALQHWYLNYLAYELARERCEAL